MTGIISDDLSNQSVFTTVFKNFIQWIKTCVTEAQQTAGVSYYPGICLSSVAITIISLSVGVRT